MEAIAALVRAGESDEAAREYRAAARHYCAAVRAGSVEGMFRLGRMIAFGKGIERDNQVAATLLWRAAEGGHAGANALLAGLGPRTPQMPACVDDPSALDDRIEPPLPQPRSVEQYAAAVGPGQRRVVELVDRLAPAYRIDPRLALAIASVESAFDLRAVSPKQAQGVMQLIPETAQRFNVRDPFHAEQNIRGGLAYLRWLLAYFQGNVRLAAAGYNAGEGAVVRHGGVPPFPETQAYVKRVLELYPVNSHPFESGLVVPSPVTVRN